MKKYPLFMTFLCKAHAGETLEINDAGDIAWEYIYTRNLDWAVWKAMETSDILGTFNIGPGETCMMNDMEWMQERRKGMP